MDQSLLHILPHSVQILQSHVPHSFVRYPQWSARGFNNKETVSLVDNWLRWRHSPQQKYGHMQE